MIVGSTNIYIYITHIKERLVQEWHAKFTDETEIHAFIGILLPSVCLGSGGKKSSKF